MELASMLSSGLRLWGACLVVDDGERSRDEGEECGELHDGCSN